jgi:integrase
MISVDEMIERCKAERKRRKFSDKGKQAIPDLYVSVTASGVATFCFKRPFRRFGVYRPEGHPQAFTLADARAAARDLLNRIERGEDVSLSARRERAAQQEREGLTVDQLIEKRIEFIKAHEPKADGKLRSRTESWKNVASHLRRLVSRRLGRKLVRDVKRSDIATLADDIIEGRFGKPSRSNARHMCMAVSGLFKWAVKRDFISSSPAIMLGEWTNFKKKRKTQKRILNDAEIKQFWHGLDREDLPHDRRTRLALKFELVTMLRGGEFMPLRKDEIHGWEGPNPYIHIPLERVKKRDHDLQQPLSSLAVEIIREALKDNDTDYVFATPQRGGRRINEPLSRQAATAALRDRDDHPGICTLLGMKKFTSHDLRRTASTGARNLGVSLSKVSMCLDHAVKREDGVSIPRVTTDHYVFIADHRELAEKREVLEKLADAIRRIVGDERSELAMAA